MQFVRQGEHRYLECRCDCGKVRTLFLPNVMRGVSTGCGCIKIGRRTHGRTESTEYEIWAGIKKRCLNPKAASYPNYGGRGVTVCDEWRDSFEAFLRDMGPRPSRNHTIERVNNDDGYSKANCVWATSIAQANNKRTTRWLTWNGHTRTMADWAREVGLPRHVIHGRIGLGWSVERALTTPVR